MCVCVRERERKREGERERKREGEREGGREWMDGLATPAADTDLVQRTHAHLSVCLVGLDLQPKTMGLQQA